MDNRPRGTDGKLHKGCGMCGILPYKCKGHCTFQQLAERAEQEEKKHGYRLQRHGRIK